MPVVRRDMPVFTYTVGYGSTQEKQLISNGDFLNSRIFRGRVTLSFYDTKLFAMTLDKSLPD